MISIELGNMGMMNQEQEPERGIPNMHEVKLQLYARVRTDTCSMKRSVTLCDDWNVQGGLHMLIYTRKIFLILRVVESLCHIAAKTLFPRITQFQSQMLS